MDSKETIWKKMKESTYVRTHALPLTDTTINNICEPFPKCLFLSSLFSVEPKNRTKGGEWRTYLGK